jgi:hypothetical protein
MCVDLIGAMAGCSRSSVQGALRTARRLGLLHVKERRIVGRKSYTNLCTVISGEWLSWLRIGAQPIGLKFSSPTPDHLSFKNANGARMARETGYGQPKMRGERKNSQGD